MVNRGVLLSGVGEVLLSGVGEDSQWFTNVRNNPVSG